jgi:hypothetical protein
MRLCSCINLQSYGYNLIYTAYDVWRFWTHKTSLTPPLFIEVPVPCQESERSCICVRGIEFATFYDFSVGIWKCSDNVVFCFCFPF